jgi:serine/threonine protein kinase
VTIQSISEFNATLRTACVLLEALNSHRKPSGKSIALWFLHLVRIIERRYIETEMENLLNLRHPMIAPLIGCVFPVKSNRQQNFKIMRLYATDDSLADVLSDPPAWWTPTMKAKVVMGIALGLRFAHGLGLLHGAVKASNILFDADRERAKSGR